MAKAGAAYPQVDPGAEALMERRIARCPSGLGVRPALALLRGADAELLLVGGRAVVRGEDLLRASQWRLRGVRVDDLAWQDLPAVAASGSEVAVRRLVMGGAQMVLVKEGRRTVGVVDGRTLARPALSVAHRLEHAPDREGEARLWLLRLAGKIGEASGVPVFVVGGFVRDLLLGRSPLDVDLVVEGDGPAFAGRLAAEVGGQALSHPSFGTASIEGARSTDGTALGRVDVAEARHERYRAPGALPTVARATLAEDLRRRDFSVNAMAVTVWPSGFGRLVDLPGAQRDLQRRCLRPLHPLSFVEDPTRIFRAARYAVRLGFRLDATGRRALRLALRAGSPRELSGQRLAAELALIVAEPGGWEALRLLARWQAFSLWDRGYRAPARVVRRLREAGRLSEWARAAGVALDEREVALLAVLLDQPPSVAARCLGRLGVTGGPARRIAGAAGGAREALGRLRGRGPRRPSEVAATLGRCERATLVAAWLLGGTAARRRIQWFLAEGRLVRPVLSGDDLVGLGVARGPRVGECLEALRRLRLDGVITTASEEQQFVAQWRVAEKGDVR